MDFIIGYAGLLILIILGLVINRHIIGGVGYNFFPPIIIGYAINILTMSYQRFSVIIISTILGWIFTKIITNYVNISLYPRYGLYMIISLGIFISNGILYIKYNSLDGLSIDESYQLIFLFLLVVAMGVKIYSGGKGFFSLIRWGHISRFFILSFLINKVLQWEYGYSYFMNHGITVILLGLFTIIVGSYTGLQIKEMIRFRKLIWAKITNKKKRT